MKIRILKPDEIPQAVALSKMVYDMAIRPNMQGQKDFFDEYVSEENLKNAVLNEGTVIWGAFDKELLVGVCAMTAFAHINMLYVHPNYTRRGIGKKLLRKARIYACMKLSCVEVTANIIPIYMTPYFLKCGFVEREVAAAGSGYAPLIAPSIYEIEYETRPIPKNVFLAVCMIFTGIVFLCGMGYAVWSNIF